jgi:hypothetical protein
MDYGYSEKTPVPEPEFKQPYIDWIFGLRNENEAKEKKAAMTHKVIDWLFRNTRVCSNSDYFDFNLHYHNHQDYHNLQD